MLKEFREFAMKGNVVGPSRSASSIGAAFGAIVDLAGRRCHHADHRRDPPAVPRFPSNYFHRAFPRRSRPANLADAKKQGAVLAWGNFLTLTINFGIIAFVLFMVIRGMNTLKRKDEAKPATAAEAVGRGRNC